ncbi:MAG: maleylpyruvate isomerase N-terminal domain-containing protein [Actinomycetales bacterium]|nr:maleylpyruvate isomerase N-terminal domain-containing protein [Candidatus Lutibacillus vidarii]
MPTSPDLLAEHTRRLLKTAATLTETDLLAPSLCVGWSRAHVLSHLARNAEGLTRLARAAVDGTGETMYAGEAERSADIESWALLPRSGLLDTLAGTAAGLADALARLRPEHDEIQVERTPGGRLFAARALPGLRLREVVYHHVDLLAGFGFDDVEPDLVERYLRSETEAALAQDHEGRAQALLRLARAADPAPPTVSAG